MRAMFLETLEKKEPAGPFAPIIEALTRAGQPVPQIMRLFAYKPDWTGFLAHFTQGVMRGPSPLSPGLRELIAVYTSKLNRCPF